MNDKLGIASEILLAVAFGVFLWGLPYYAAAVAAVALALAGYKRISARQA